MKIHEGILVVCALIGSSLQAVAAQGNSPQKCGLGEHWVRSHHRRAYIRADGLRFRSTMVAAHCRGNPPSYSFWNQRLKDGAPPGWPIGAESAKKWTEEECERVLEALGFLPPDMSIEDIRGIYRMDKSRFYPNPASGDRDGDIVLYDNAFEEGKNLSQILSHEISHRIFESLTPAEAEDYRFQAGWSNLGNPGKPDYVLLRKGRVAADSSDGIGEDFSNNVEYFLFNPLKLKEAAPGAYSWIAKRFGASFKLGKGHK